jgi:hypothetical protein
MLNDSTRSSVIKTKEVLQVYLNLPEIVTKFENDQSMRRYVDMVSNILTAEVDFVLKSYLKRGGSNRRSGRRTGN